MTYVILLIISYLLGSIPVALLLVKLAGKGDIRQVSSGNVGATNAARVLGMAGFVITWVMDMAKVIVPVLIGKWLVGMSFGALCGAVAIVGHIFPIWLRGFKGGKGVSALFGYMLALNPIIFVSQGLTWLIVGLPTGYSSLAAWVNWILLPVFGFAVDFWTGIVCIPLAILGLWAQRENIKRFIDGKESKMQMNMGKMALVLIIIGFLFLGAVIAINVI
ncbi:MAG: glycerol-3-phosphate 1-O-acyltransferase PlsY [Rickettsiales bacterium]|jgi:glycerol-3-phosphate acyltransferase PlsY|nr:glycerol-3-phosphate 1-O-acyltransferase PlsY [Rickettsiales bacterium]